MIYKQKIHVPSSDKIVELYVAPCLDCNSDDIKIDEYEDEYGFISTVTCKNCKRKVSQNFGEAEVIKMWNESNDIALLVKSKFRPE